MPVVITNDTQDVLLREEIMLSARQLLSPSIIEERMQLQYDFGVADFSELYFDGLHISYGNAQIFQNLHVAVELADLPTMVTQHFVVHGDLVTNLPGRAPCRFTSLEHNVLYNPDLCEHAQLKKQDGIEVVTISFTKERFLELAENNGHVLARLGEDVAGDRAVFLNRDHNQPITMQMLKVLEEIKSCRFQGGIKKLFLQSKALELLALQCDQYERTAQTALSMGALSVLDREKILYARDLLVKAAQQPPSLRELSRQAGLNEFKLKSGFKQVFHNTVFGYLNDHRLEQARQFLLQQDQRSLSEIAGELGYSSPQHFSNAFSKKFGVSPGKIRK